MLSESEEDRVSPMIPPPPPLPELAELMEMVMGPDTLGGRALSLNGAFATDGNPMTLSADFRLDAATIRAALSVLPTAVVDGEQ